jgi:hypothetical protein
VHGDGFDFAIGDADVCRGGVVVDQLDAEIAVWKGDLDGNVEFRRWGWYGARGCVRDFVFSFDG